MDAELLGRAKSIIAGTSPIRYAPLSSGLEIVRKTLGQHEIATDSPLDLIFGAKPQVACSLKPPEKFRKKVPSPAIL
jgi:hypothetical protein